MSALSAVKNKLNPEATDAALQAPTPAGIEFIPAPEAKTIEELTTSVNDDPWASIAATAEFAPVFKRGPAVDVERDIPASLRILFEQSLTEYGMEFPHPSGNTLPANTPKYRHLNAGSLDKADELIKLGKKWAKNRRVDGAEDNGQVSIRIFAAKHQDGGKSSTVHYAVSPLVKSEARRVPGTAGDGSAKLIRAWAIENGISVPDRGRIPADIRAKYDVAKAQDAAIAGKNPATDRAMTDAAIAGQMLITDAIQADTAQA
jgi:hypothetical protein